ncbi:hypothetical protein K2173_014081 [Erythroxylum novogranatense]|uniref:Uncharacterized protein n=1 Tax=Erythroxylum novogranatense TaxID=1862640 RepID=A0AAV8SDQ5_9ROSI|nr:hypothetical protein K2173_014081 [Erythroxylum novogranatense]
MSLIPKNSKSLVKTTTSRRRSTTSVAASRRRVHPLAVTPQRKNGKGLSKVSDKLEALKNLIPTQYGDNVKADQLFQETADYIVQLRTQIFVMQRLIKFYGSTNSVTDNFNAVR